MAETIQRENGWQSMFAGALAGSTSVALLYPLDLIRTRFQVQDALGSPSSSSSSLHFRNTFSARYTGLLHAFRSIVAQDGAGALYRGLSTNMVGSALAWGCYFHCFHWLQREAAARFYEHPPPSSSSSSSKQTHRALVPVHVNLLCGLAAGIAGQLLTNPFWVVKTRIQVDASGRRYAGMAHGLASLWRHEGAVGLFRGVVPGLWSTVHGSIQFAIYEEMLKLASLMRGTRNESGARAHSLDVTCAGGLSKVMASLITYPAFLIRSRLQLERTAADVDPYARGAARALVDVWRRDGITALYRGWTISLVRTVPASAITFLVFENTLKLMRWFDEPRR
jgi:solute carrier family 25 (mitochondrial folate transporter), member 32